MPCAAGLLQFKRQATGSLRGTDLPSSCQAACGSFACSALDRRFGQAHTFEQLEHGGLGDRVLTLVAYEAEARVKVLTLFLQSGGRKTPLL